MNQISEKQQPDTPVSANLADRVSWQGASQTRASKYRRFIGLSKRFSIFLGTRFPNAFPLLFVLGHPKSGTSWMCQLLADYLRLPFPQHSILPLGCSAVLHSFEAPSRKYKSGVYMLRDGRDSAVSTYFHVRGRLLGGSKAKFHKRMFEGLDLEAEPVENMETFLRRLHAHPPGGWTKLPSWGAHVGAHYEHTQDKLCLVRYEDLLADGPGTLSKLILELTGSAADEARVMETLDRFSFKRQTGRKQGDENRNSYLRKGESGDWVNHFCRKSAEFFDEVYGEVLIQCGYENNRDWIKQV